LGPAARLVRSRPHSPGCFRGTATALNELALVATYRGDFETARRLLDRSLTIKRELGDQWLVANSLVNLGLVAGYQRDYQVAYEIHRESLALYRELDDTVGVATATGNLGYVAMKLGRLEEAQAHQAESLQLFHHVGDTDGLAESLERHAMLALAESEPIRAAELFGAARALREDVDILLVPAESAELESAIDTVRAGLGAADFEAAWRVGTGMSRDEALAVALGRLSSQPEPHSGAGTV
jgi:tetratricopeptide (TPR) repeat protein